MTKKMWRKFERMKAEHAQTEAAGRKRGLWSSLGSTLLGGVATILTAGAAAPTLLASLGTGLAAGGASFVGGHLGNWLAGRTDKGDLSGGRYYTEERRSLGKQIKEGIGAKAVSTGMQSALFSALKGIKGKGKGVGIKGKGKGVPEYPSGGSAIEAGKARFREDIGLHKMTPKMRANLREIEAYGDIAERYDLDISKMSIGGGGARPPLSSAIDPTKRKLKDFFYSATPEFHTGPSDVARTKGEASTFSQMLEEGPAYIEDRLGKSLLRKDKAGVVKSGDPRITTFNDPCFIFS